MITENQTPTQQFSMLSQAITIRPIRLSDTEMEAEFISHLSAESRQYRFLGAVKELPITLLQQLCDVDGHHSMAFVATIEENGKETEIGISRFAPNTENNVREMAVTVSDDWQNQGLGTALANQLISFARGHGVRKLYSIDLADNVHMRHLASDLGMTAQRDPNDAHQVIYSMTL